MMQMSITQLSIV